MFILCWLTFLFFFFKYFLLIYMYFNRWRIYRYLKKNSNTLLNLLGTLPTNITFQTSGQILEGKSKYIKVFWEFVCLASLEQETKLLSSGCSVHYWDFKRDVRLDLLPHSFCLSINTWDKWGGNILLSFLLHLHLLLYMISEQHWGNSKRQKTRIRRKCKINTLLKQLLLCVGMNVYWFI